MPQCYLETRIKQIYLGEDIKRAYIGSELFFSRSQKVTYYVDTNNIYEDEIDYGEPCFASATNNFKPNNFTPQKQGYTFLGWVENANNVPNAETMSVEHVKNNYVLQEKIMGEEPINLYAVFTKTVTVTFKRLHGTKPTTQVPKPLYYNNNNVSKPSFSTPSTEINGAGVKYNGWEWRGWSYSGTTTANAGVLCGNNVNLGKLDSNATYYGLYLKSIQLSYNGNGGSGSISSQSGTVYCNANNANNILGCEFTLASSGFTKRSYGISAWAESDVNGTQRAKGSKVTLKSSTTYYAIWTYNTVTHILNNNPAWSQLAAYDDVQLQSSHWKVDYQGCITFGTSIDVSKITKISIRFNHSRDEDGKVKLSLYLPNVSGFTSDKERTNLVKTTDWILAPSGNSITVDFDVSTLTGNRYISIYIDDVTNNGHATCSLYGVSYV